MKTLYESSIHISSLCINNLNRCTRIYIVCTVIALILVTVLFVFRGEGETYTVAQKSVIVETSTVKKISLPEYIVELGFLIPDQRIVVTTRSTGYIKNINVREGQAVRKDDSLIVMDSNSLDASIMQQKALLEAREIDLRDAERDMHYTPLARQGAFARNDLYKIQIRLKSAKAAREYAKAALDSALAERAYTLISSPFDGVIIEKHKDVGDMAVHGEPILTLDSRMACSFVCTCLKAP